MTLLLILVFCHYVAHYLHLIHKPDQQAATEAIFLNACMYGLMVFMATSFITPAPKFFLGAMAGIAFGCRFVINVIIYTFVPKMPPPGEKPYWPIFVIGAMHYLHIALVIFINHFMQLQNA